ncbi:MAG: hypothetical protein KAW47_03395 [Thermoplasmatales archaeon]|nr:hypothetical protein [Thermoplasmatales archaeon]
MKEGYLQTKIAELNDKCKQIDQMISMEKSKLLLLQEQVGGFKELLKKLKNIEDVKEQTVSRINEENEKLIKSHIEELSKNVTGIIETSLKRKTKKIDETLDYLREREGEINQQAETIAQQTKDINFLIEHNNLLMMKLANKGILTQREIDEMHRRSSKKAQKE